MPAATLTTAVDSFPARQKEIDAGNSRLLKNLTSIAQKGAYDPATLDADFRKHQEHLARISRFPPPE